MSTNIKAVATGASLIFPEIAPVIGAVPSRWLTIRGKTPEITIDEAKNRLNPIFQTYIDNVKNYLISGDLYIYYPNQNKGGQWRPQLRYKSGNVDFPILSLWYGVKENSVMYSIGEFPDAKTNKGMKTNPVELNEIINFLRLKNVNLNLKEVKKEDVKKEEEKLNKQIKAGWINQYTIIAIIILSFVIIVYFLRGK